MGVGTFGNNFVKNNATIDAGEKALVWSMTKLVHPTYAADLAKRCYYSIAKMDSRNIQLFE
jgi:hypothetical protein